MSLVAYVGVPPTETVYTVLWAVSAILALAVGVESTLITIYIVKNLVNNWRNVFIARVRKGERVAREQEEARDAIVDLDAEQMLSAYSEADKDQQLAALKQAEACERARNHAAAKLENRSAIIAGAPEMPRRPAPAPLSIRDAPESQVMDEGSSGRTTVSVVHNTVRLVPPQQPLESTARLAGRIVGRAIRLEMGLPTYTVANRIVAVQRINAARKDQYPSMRVAHQDLFVEQALYHVFTPSPMERRVYKRLHTFDGAEVRSAPVGTWVKVYPLVPLWIQRWAGLAEFIGPDFQ